MEIAAEIPGSENINGVDRGQNGIGTNRNGGVGTEAHTTIGAVKHFAICIRDPKVERIQKNSISDAIVNGVIITNTGKRAPGIERLGNRNSGSTRHIDRPSRAGCKHSKPRKTYPRNKRRIIILPVASAVMSCEDMSI